MPRGSFMAWVAGSREDPLGPANWRRFLTDEDDEPPRDGRFGWGWAVVIGIVLALLAGRRGG